MPVKTIDKHSFCRDSFHVDHIIFEARLSSRFKVEDRASQKSQ